MKTWVLTSLFDSFASGSKSRTKRECHNPSWIWSGQNCEKCKNLMRLRKYNRSFHTKLSLFGVCALPLNVEEGIDSFSIAFYHFLISLRSRAMFEIHFIYTLICTLFKMRWKGNLSMSLDTFRGSTRGILWGSCKHDWQLSGDKIDKNLKVRILFSNIFIGIRSKSCICHSKGNDDPNIWGAIWYRTSL